ENNSVKKVKVSVITLILVAAIFSQNLIPIHVAFIPILIPPLLSIFHKINLDRRIIACVLSFGLVTPYMFLPFGFGQMFLNELIRPELIDQGLTEADTINMSKVMVIPVIGMILGLILSIFVSYRKPRQYQTIDIQCHKNNSKQTLSKKEILLTSLALTSFVIVQLKSNSMALGALTGAFILSMTSWKKSNSLFSEGTKLMASIGITMMAASGFAQVMHDTGGISVLVEQASEAFSGNALIASGSMLLVGLLVTLGIGSSFATIPLLTSIYVPIGLSVGLSVEAIACLVIVSGVLGDTGSPISEVTLTTSAALNQDGQHDHIKDTVIPTFFHFNVPLLLFGLISISLL
ncbi:sodium:proton antiporter, partial [Vibrio agarivorans]